MVCVCDCDLTTVKERCTADSSRWFISVFLSTPHTDAINIKAAHVFPGCYIFIGRLTYSVHHHESPTMWDTRGGGVIHRNLGSTLTTLTYASSLPFSQSFEAPYSYHYYYTMVEHAVRK